MFPDTDIAKNYSMSEAKIKYLLVFGVAPFVREQLIDDLKSTPFTFMFHHRTGKETVRRLHAVQFSKI